MSLFLVGLRGAGKTSAGCLAARLLGVSFVDTDTLIEQRQKKSVAALFATEGEAAFRTVEKDVLREVLPRAGHIVATGGGCVQDPDTHAALARSGRTIWLTATLDVLRQRIKGSARPSLTGAAVELELDQLLAQREALYGSCAWNCLDTSELSLSEVAQQLMHFWRQLHPDDASSS